MTFCLVLVSVIKYNRHRSEDSATVFGLPQENVDSSSSAGEDSNCGGKFTPMDQPRYLHSGKKTNIPQRQSTTSRYILLLINVIAVAGNYA